MVYNVYISPVRSQNRSWIWRRNAEMLLVIVIEDIWSPWIPMTSLFLLQEFKSNNFIPWNSHFGCPLLPKSQILMLMRTHSKLMHFFFFGWLDSSKIDEFYTLIVWIRMENQRPMQRDLPRILTPNHPKSIWIYIPVISDSFLMFDVPFNGLSECLCHLCGLSLA